MKEALREALLQIWQSPQHILGGLLTMLYRTKDSDIYDTGLIKNNKFKVRAQVLASPKMKSGISLGEYIIVSKNASDTTIRHELGHSRQSIILGPLYLLIIGLPSLLNNIFGFTKNYYDFYTEKWADNLAEIKRK